MSNRDEVDWRRAQQYAWRIPSPDDAALADPKICIDPQAHQEEAESSADEAPVDTKSTNEESDWRRAVMATAAQLASLVHQAWMLPEGKPQAQVVTKLLREALHPEQTMMALSISDPLAGVRLIRLAHRHYCELGDEADGIMMPLCLFADFGHPDAAELLLDIARSGDQRFARWLELPLAATWKDPARWQGLRRTELCARLCALVDEGFPFPTQELALDFMFLCCSEVAVPTLRRALALPHLGIRWRALTLLLQAFSPPALEVSELRFLLSDLFVHPPVRQRRNPFWAEGAAGYHDGLREAMVKLRPSEGAALLRRILRWEDVPKALGRSECDDRWALRTLAAAYPELALPYVDGYLNASRYWNRFAGVEAAAELSAEQARPRLLRAAADGAPIVAERARSRFEELFELPCPLQPLDGLDTELVRGPPSERLLGRLQVLRSPSEEARQAMLEVLLDEAPDEEALALILFLMADDALLIKQQRRRLPKNRDQLVVRLYRRFGPRALEGLCRLAERYPASDGSGGLLELIHLVRTVRLPKRDAGPLRDLALRRMRTEEFMGRQIALMLLSMLGAPVESRVELLDWVVQGAAAWIFAADAVARGSADRTLTAALIDHLTTAWSAGNGAQLNRLTSAVPRRPSAQLTKVLLRLLSDWTDLRPPAAAASDSERRRYAEPEMQTAMQTLARRLLDVAKLPPRWGRAALAAPTERAFLLAVNLLETDELDDDAVAQLVRALDTPLRECPAALEAAVNLLRHEKGVAADDPRLVRLAQEVLGEWRARLLFMMLYRGAAIEPLRATIIAALCTDDPEEAESMAGSLHLVSDKFGLESLAALLPKVRAPQLAKGIALLLERAQEQQVYWQDGDARTARPARGR